MHLRDGEGGGTAYQEADHANGANGLTNGTVDPSSTRTIAVAPRDGAETDVAAYKLELLLAWLLVLYRNNDDGLSRVNWGFRTREGQQPSSATHNSLNLSEVPFSKENSIAEALQVIKDLDANESDGEAQTVPVIYFNNGTPAQNGAEKTPSKRSHDVRRPVHSPNFTNFLNSRMLICRLSGHTRSKRQSLRSRW